MKEAALGPLHFLRFHIRFWKAVLSFWRGSVIDAIEKTGCADEPLFFVQVGAHTGRENDPVRPLVEKSGWRGILVEPLRPLFEQLVENYAHCRGLVFENAAIGEEDGEASFYHVANDKDLPAWASQIGSLDATTVRSHQALSSRLEGRIVESRLPCLTLCSLLAKHGSPEVNAVFSDAEGYDFKILRQIDLDDPALRLVVFEHVHLSREERREAYRMLEASGFRIRRLAWDTVAHRRAGGRT